MTGESVRSFPGSRGKGTKGEDFQQEPSPCSLPATLQEGGRERVSSRLAAPDFTWLERRRQELGLYRLLVDHAWPRLGNSSGGLKERSGERCPIRTTGAHDGFGIISNRGRLGRVRARKPRELKDSARKWWAWPAVPREFGGPVGPRPMTQVASTPLKLLCIGGGNAPIGNVTHTAFRWTSDTQKKSASAFDGVWRSI